MNFWGAYPFLRFALALAGGIAMIEYFPLKAGVLALAGGILAVLVFWLSFSKEDSARVVQGFLSFCLLLSLGGLLAQLHEQTNHPGHYIHFKKIRSFRAILVSDASDREGYLRFEAEVTGVLTDSGAAAAVGKILVYQKKSAQSQELHYGDELLVKGDILLLNAPKNPYEFDYKNYLENQNIYGQTFVSGDELVVTGYSSPNLLVKWSLQARARGVEVIQLSIPRPREQAILEALVLGVKDHLDNEIRDAYSAAGAMHVLAVSGLHVGIVFIVLGALLGFLKRTPRGRLFFVAITFTSIWAYALITGFSASVLRATIMFSVILISSSAGRQFHIYNSLGLAAFLLLLYDPLLIYSVGFQLSFVAVFGIVYLHPILYSLWSAPNKVVDYLWSITSMSIAAQAATTPLTTYYFHQFPTYFLISNLVVIPVSFVILVGGIAMLLLGAVWSLLGIFIGKIVFGLTWFMNASLLALTYLPYPVVEGLYLDMESTLLLGLLLIFLAVACSRRRRTPLVIALGLLLTLSIRTALLKWEQLSRKEIVIYGVKDHIAIDLIEGKNVILLIDTLKADELDLLEYQINPNRLANGLKPIKRSMEYISESPHTASVPGGNLIVWRDFKILIVREPGIQLAQLATADLILLNTSRVKDLPETPVVLGAGIRHYQHKLFMEKQKNVHSLLLEGFYQVKL